MICGEAKGGLKDGALCPLFPERTSVGSTCVANLKPVPQVEAPGQADGPFPQADQGCVSVCSLGSVFGVVAFPERSF